MSSSPSRLAAVLAVACLPAWAGPIGFRTSALPLGAAGSPYRALLETFVDGRCIDGGASFALVEGELPAGLELRGNTITGVPREQGAFPVRIVAGNDCG